MGILPESGYNTGSSLPDLNSKNSFDTFNFLNNDMTRQSFLNTSHSQIITRNSDQKSSKNSNSQSNSNNDESTFNQVPRQFSQFISDQQLPPGVQDEYSIDSPFINGIEFSRFNDNLLPSSFQQQDQYSQDTVFSTRKRRFLKKTSPTKPPKVLKHNFKQPNETNHNLQRKSAIKVKNGSLWYRFKLRMRKLMKKMKFNFPVSSKRLASNTNVKRKFSRKFFAFPCRRKINTDMISNPHTNSQLGTTSVVRIAAVDDNVKKLAGNQLDDENRGWQVSTSQEQFEENLLGESARYILELPNNKECEPSTHQQQNDYNFIEKPESYDHKQVNQSSKRTNFSNIPETYIRRSFGPWKNTNEKTWFTMVDLWKSYLSQALVKRIQIRQEINEFLDFIVTKELSKSTVNLESKKPTRSSTLDASTKPSAIRSQLHSSIDIESVESDIDSITDDFNKQLHRKSMLGNLLEYYSDDDASTISHFSSLSNILDSIQASDSIMVRYSTIKRPSHKPKSITRSEGVAYRLTAMAV